MARGGRSGADERLAAELAAGKTGREAAMTADVTADVSDFRTFSELVFPPTEIGRTLWNTGVIPNPCESLPWWVSRCGERS
jgi:hypothetical protein